MLQKIISFDIGIKNLAYCVFLHDLSSNPIIAWDVLDISKEMGPKEEDGEKTVTESLTCTCSLASKSTKKKTDQENCKKKAKYRNKTDELFCEKHAKERAEKKEYYLPTKEFQIAFLKKQKVDFLVEFERKYDIGAPSAPKEKKEDRLERLEKWLQEKVLEPICTNSSNKKKKEEIGLVQIGRNMANQLRALPETMDGITTVLIENQISPIANKMKTIQGMLAQIYILHGVENIEFISSCNKLKGFSSLEKEEPKKEKKTEQKETERKEKEEKGENPNPNYKKHKKDGIAFCKELLEKREKEGEQEKEKEGKETKWKTFFENYPKKQDDLADAFLQGIWYMKKTKQ